MESSHSDLPIDRTRLPQSITQMSAASESLPGERTEALSAPGSDEGQSELPDIPGYRLVGQIARGGMGRVLSAVDLVLEREVAIKVLLPHRSAVRFVNEAKITARLPHPCVPPVYALGKLEDGTPWLAMKLIRGRTLSEILESTKTAATDNNGEDESTSRNLSMLLQVFEQIAHAVGFAHSRGIIHRDLKPQNIMVGEFGEVQIMDWGLAKIVRADLQAESLSSFVSSSPGISPLETEETMQGSIMGTPSYMAPEQARGEEVDQRADVFSLGSILVCMLTGKPAFVGRTVRQTIEKAASGDIGDAMQRLDQCRADPEVVAIARRCLAVDPNDRYEDARQLAAVVSDYRQSVARRLREAETERAEARIREAEQRKRRRQLTWASSAIILSLSVGMIVSLLQMRRAQQAETKARQNELQALANEAKANQERNAKDAALRAEKEAVAERTHALEAEKAAKELAEKRRSMAEASLRFAQRANELLSSVFIGLNPVNEFQSVAEFREAIHQRILKVMNELDAEQLGDPVVVARLQHHLGDSLTALGDARNAERVLARAVEARRKALGPEHPDTLNALVSFASAKRELGQYAEALKIMEECAKGFEAAYGRNHIATLTALSNVGALHQDLGHWKLACELQEDLVRRLRASLGDSHLATIKTLGHLGESYRRMGDLHKAFARFEEAKNSAVNYLGPENILTLQCMNNLATCYWSLREYHRAIEIFETTLPIQIRKLGENHPATLLTKGNLGVNYVDSGQPERAIPLLEVCYQNISRDRTLSFVIPALIEAYKETGKTKEAAALIQEQINGARRASSGRGGEYVALLLSRGRLLLQLREFGMAEAVFREALGVQDKERSDSWVMYQTMVELGSALRGQKKLDQAAQFLIQGYRGLKIRKDFIPKSQQYWVRKALDLIIELYQESGRTEEVKKWELERSQYNNEGKQQNNEKKNNLAVGPD